MSALSFQSDHPFKSLDKIKWENISDFSVVTGVNGSGKTHLLELIASSLGYPIEKKSGWTLLETRQFQGSSHYIWRRLVYASRQKHSI